MTTLISMDNNNTSQPNTLFKANPSAFQPTQNPITPSPLSKFLNWLRTHKKLTLTLTAIIFLLIALIYFGSSTLQNLLNKNNSNIQSYPENQTSLNSSMLITSSKSTYSTSETIPVSIKASSAGISVTGFDTLIEYDPEFLTITKKDTPPLQDFIYYGQNTENLIQVSAVRKPDGNTLQTFDNTELFKIEFKPLKTGKTTLNIIYLPNATNDSNLIDGNSKDVLGSARGLEIQINQ